VAVVTIPSNCLVFALGKWIKSRCRGWIMVRRSQGLKGLIPHFAYAEERDGALVVTDFIPKHRKSRFLDHGDFALFFRGIVRTMTFEMVSKQSS
jgi:hypothetical protein